MIFPITYAMIIVWLILLIIDDPQYWTRFILRVSAILIGIITGIRSIAGEQWLAIDSSNNLSLTQFNDGFAFPIGLILIIISIYMILILGMSILGADYAKAEAIHTP